MRRSVLALVSLLVFVAAAGAAHAAGPFDFTLSSRGWSRYLSPAGVIVHKDPVLQTDLNIGSPWGLYLDVWHSMGLDGTGLNSDFGDEIDYFVGWTGKAGKVTFNLGAAYIDLYSLNGPVGEDLLQFYGEASVPLIRKDSHTVSPFLRLEYYTPPFGAVPDPYGSVRAITGAGHSWDLGPVASFEQKLSLVYDDGKPLRKAAGIAQYQAGLAWKVRKNFDVEFPSVKFSLPLTSTGDERKFEGIVGMGIVLRF